MRGKIALKVPFIKFSEDTARLPHSFKAYRYQKEDMKCWKAVVEGCLESWRIKAETFYENVSETGFKKTVLDKILNSHGKKRLPPTPPEDSQVTRNPAITDMTEVLALQVLKWKEKDLIFPYPRVLHKESFRLQHHGIDAIGYKKNSDEYTLYVIEVMASVEDKHPPATVRDHLTQILPDTLDAAEPERLLNDLQTLHDESSDEHKDIINGFIIATYEGSFSSSASVVATPILIRRFDEFHRDDWVPFTQKSGSFELAKIPSNLLFIAIECHESFSGLLDLIKESASGVNNSEIENGEN
jgi:hypothetical protein